jgi:hypothetical protein
VSAARTADPVDLGGGFTAVRFDFGATVTETPMIQEGMRVRVSDPAYATPEPDDDEGYVNPVFFGVEGTVLHRSTLNGDGVWDIERDDSEDDDSEPTNYIHENWLTPLEPPLT